MKFATLLAGLLALAGAVPAVVHAQAPAAASSAAVRLEGRPVRGAGGVVLGEVERVVLHTDGRPAQVLVRPKGLRPAGLRSLSYSALKIEADGVSVPLTKAEFDAMPAVDAAPR